VRIPQTSCIEDTRSEIAALGVGASDRVLSVTASGCRSLNLLVSEPRAVVSVSARAAESHLLELKIAAIRALDRDDFLAFVGIRDQGGDRPATYRVLRGELSAAAAGFWDAHGAAIGAGVMYSGATEAYHRRTLAFALRPRAELTRRLFECGRVAGQRALYDSRWDGLWWRGALRATYDPHLWRLLARDAEWPPLVDAGVPLARYMHGRFENALRTRLVRDNHALAILLLGRYHDDALPPYLLASNYELVRAQLDKLEVVTAPLEGYLAGVPDGRFDAFSLSYLPQRAGAAFETILAAVVRTGREAARVCLRNFGPPRPLPSWLLERATPLDDLAAQLDVRDGGFTGRFQVAQLL
jgi:S-adenosylmethionine-diacylglycerol 3-amino-3-carboxypropyl transferase